MATVRVRDWEFDYTDTGSGPAVLLLHGFPEDKECWQPLGEHLLAAGYRVVAFDQRGYSPGARPTRTSDYTLDHLTDDALGVLDALGIERAHVVGHDWGGAVAWGLASQAPERLLSLTVLSTPHPNAMKFAATRSTQALKSWYMGLFMMPKIGELAMRPSSPMWQAIMRGLPAESAERYTARANRPGAMAAMLQWYRAVPLEVRSPFPWKPITVSTLYIWGARDPALGSVAARATAAEVEGDYHFVALPDRGHWLPEKATDDVAPLLLEHLSTSQA